MSQKPRLLPFEQDEIVARLQVVDGIHSEFSGFQCQDEEVSSALRVLEVDKLIGIRPEVTSEGIALLGFSNTPNNNMKVARWGFKFHGNFTKYAQVIYKPARLNNLFALFEDVDVIKSEQDMDSKENDDIERILVPLGNITRFVVQRSIDVRNHG